MPELSVVIPFFEEEAAVEPLLDELTCVLEGIGRPFEVIAVDDGSRDRTFERLARSHERDGRVRVVRLRRNFGQTAALAAGFAEVRGEIVITMDGDLQNDPAVLPDMLKKLDEGEGFDLVSGWRRERQDATLTRVLPSRIANSIISRVTEVQLHDYGCGLKVYRTMIVRELRLYGEMHRFLPAIAADLGARVCEMPVPHRPRTLGRSKYGLSRSLRVVLDLLTVKFIADFSTRPMQIFGRWGLLIATAGTALLAWLGFERIVRGVPLGGRPIVLLAIVLVLSGVQFVTFGLLGEMLARSWHESQGKPIYSIRERRG